MGIPESIKYKLTTDNSLSLAEVTGLISAIPWKLDQDYLSFISAHDGFSGVLANGLYLSIWKVVDVISLYPYYPEVGDAHNLMFFGSDGASFGFAFSKNTNDVVGIDFLEIGLVAPKRFGNGFFAFLDHLDELRDLN